MNPLPQLLVIDVDGLIRANSRDPQSPFYRITAPRLSVFKPNVHEAFELLFAAEINFVICTKQRGLGDGTIKKEDFAQMWDEIERKIHPKYWKAGMWANVQIPLYVETERPTKIEQFKRIQRDYHLIPPAQITVIDDSAKECAAAASIGMNPILSTNLWATMCEIVEVVP